MEALDSQAVACPKCGAVMRRGEFVVKLVLAEVVETEETMPLLVEQRATFQCGQCGHEVMARASFL